eukprot:5163249-Alexandrium_andersonii.AAC.1
MSIPSALLATLPGMQQAPVAPQASVSSTLTWPQGTNPSGTAVMSQGIDDMDTRRGPDKLRTPPTVEYGPGNRIRPDAADRAANRP